MCCARTAALQGDTKSACESHAGLRAATKTLYPKTMSKTAPRAGQNMARRHPQHLKIEPGGTQVHPDATKRHPRAPKRHPKDAQECPRDTQEWPRGAQERPKGTQDAPRRLPDTSKTEPGDPQNEFLAQSSWEGVFDRLLERFYVVFWLVPQACHVQKTWKNL